MAPHGYEERNYETARRADSRYLQVLRRRVANLRRKLELTAAERPCGTVRGAGYRFELKIASWHGPRTRQRTVSRRIPGMASEYSVLRDGLFADRTALVTGAGRGMGRDIALRFAALGASVIATGRHMETLEETATLIRNDGGHCLPHTADIRETEQIDALVEASLAEFRRIDFVINNAGGQFPARPSQISDRGWRSVIDLNLNGTWNVLSRVGPLLTAQKFGAVVNIVHVYSFDRGAPPFAHSGAARAGVVNLTRTLANYWARQNVTINALAPGSISTEALREKEYAQLGTEDYETHQLHDVPSHRLGEREEMAEICAFLCSPAARYINGSVITADGGQSLGNWTDVWDMELP